MLKYIRKAYLLIIKSLANKNNPRVEQLILYRLDQNNFFLRDKKNLSGIPTGKSQEYINEQSLKFYKYLKEVSDCNELTIKNVPLYNLYTRQVKLKLAGILRCAYRIQNHSNSSHQPIQIVSDKQSASIFRHALTFINFEEKRILWKINFLLSCLVTINSLVLRLLSLIKMFTTNPTLPDQYFIKDVDPDLYNIVIALPRRNPMNFYLTYVKQFEGKFNIILYCHGAFKGLPESYKIVKIKKRFAVIKGIFAINALFLNTKSYIHDILIIFKYHFNLSISLDIVDEIFKNKVDILINRLQTNVVDNYLAIKARSEKAFILGDIFEEIFFCDSLVLSSRSKYTAEVKHIFNDQARIAYKGIDSLINYRLKGFNNENEHYLHDLLSIDQDKKIIFYASDPSKEESQRYFSEKFLIEQIKNRNEYCLVIKTHAQDNGRITNYAFLDSNQPENTILIGDILQKKDNTSKVFNFFQSFNFNSAIASSDAFLTTSSSSILQALKIGVKSGIIDKFNNGYHGYLTNYDIVKIIFDGSDLDQFLDNRHSKPSEELLSYLGLGAQNENFDICSHVLRCYKDFQLESNIKVVSK